MNSLVITITVPVGRRRKQNLGYVSQYAGNFRMSEEQAAALSELRAGLAHDGQVLHNGRAVSNSTQAFQWLLEAFGAALAVAEAEETAIDGFTQAGMPDGAVLPGMEQLKA